MKFTPRADSDSALVRALAFKAYEIEELTDVYFTRPLGAVIAYGARALRLTPTQVTVAGGCIGIVAGSLLYDERLGLWAFGLLMVHAIFDSADGQLARLTGQVSERGSVLDGVAGYATHAAAYLAIIAGVIHRGGSGTVAIWACLAAVANVIHAQLYDYHRTAYANIVVRGVVRREQGAPADGRWEGRLLLVYRAAQRHLIGAHGDVEAKLAARSVAGEVARGDREWYRRCFYWPVRGWNLLGDNNRRYAIGVLAWLNRIDLFFAFILVPLNLALAVLWFWQARADRRFLDRP